MMNFDDLAPKWIVRLMVECGLTDYQAAGILGNLGFESGGFAYLQEIKPLVTGSRGGLGIAQWTGPRRVAFERWCADNSLSTASPEGNFGFLLHELKGSYASTVSALKRCVTLETAVFSVGQTYERPYGTTRTNLPGYAGRLEYGRRALAGARREPATNTTTAETTVETPHPDLRLGSKGDAVRELQRRLTALGFPCGRVDGSYGNLTDGAVEAFQKARKIWPGTVVLGSTWNELAQAEAER